MLWFVYSLLAALFQATSDALVKRNKLNNDFVILWAQYVFSFPVVVLLLLFTVLPSPDLIFWIATAFFLPLNVLAVVLIIKAIRLSPLSLTMPFMSFTPVFLLFTSYLLLGEKPSPVGLFGILFIVAGTYILNLRRHSHDLLDPFKAILRQPGTIVMIIASFLLAITANFYKLAVHHSSPHFFVVFMVLVMSVILSVMYYRHIRRHAKDIMARMPSLAMMGTCHGIMLLFTALALPLAIVPYMIAVKRSSLLFDIIIGNLFFKEADLRQHLFGGTVMLLGGIIILLG